MLKDRVAIVTGGTRGLGSVIAQQLRENGAMVFALGRSTVNVTNQHDIDSIVREIIRENGRIDILVNNAAVLGPVGQLETNDWDQWRLALETNLLGPVYFTRACLPHMKERGSGKIINIVGGGATEPLPRRSAYATSKAALVRFTETVAEEVRDFGIDVNAVAPGPMATGMLDDLIEAGPGQLGEREHTAHMRIRDEGGTPLELAARLCVYLASASSGGVSGRTIAARFDAWPFSEDMKAQIRRSDIFTMRRVREAV